MRPKRQLFKLTSALLILCAAIAVIFHACKSNPVESNENTIEKLYVLNAGSSNVSVIDLSKNEVVATIDIGEEPNAMVYSDSRKEVYVSNRVSRNISVIDVATDSVIAEIAINAFPQTLATPTGDKLYALVDSDTSVALVKRILIVDLNSYALVDTLIDSLSVYDSCTTLVAIATDATRLYGTGRVSTCFPAIFTPLIIDLANHKIIRQNRFEATSISLAPDGEHIYLSTSYFGIFVFDTKTMETAGIAEAGNFSKVVFSASAHQAFVANRAASTILVIDTVSKTVESRMELDFEPYDLVLSEAKGMIYVTNPSRNEIAQIDLTKGQLVQTFGTGTNPREILLVQLDSI